MPVAGDYVRLSPGMVLTTSATNTFQVGAINVKNDMYNIMARSTVGAQFITLDSSGASLTETSRTAPTSATGYPAAVGEVNGLNSYNPSLSTRWVALYNNTSSKGNYYISLEKMKVTINDGDKQLVTVNNSLGSSAAPYSYSILNLEVSMSADTAYLVMITNVQGSTTFTNRIIDLNVIDPQGTTQLLSTALSAIYQTGSLPTYYFVFTAKVSGPHEFYFRLSYLGSISSAQFEVHSIPQSSLSSGNMQQFGDDPLTTTQDQINQKTFKYWAFTINVGAGDTYSYFLQQQISGAGATDAILIVEVPGTGTGGSYGYSYFGAVASVGETYSCATANGKVIVIAIETSFRQATTYRVILRDINPNNIDIPTIENVNINPNYAMTLHFNVPGTMLFRLRILAAAGSASPSINGLGLKVRNSFVIYPTDLSINVYNNTVFTNGSTELMDQVYFLQQGDYYCYLDNTGNTKPAFLSVMTMITADSPVVVNSINMWNGNFYSGAWHPFNDVSNFTNNVTFSDLGKGTGAMVPQVLQFSINQLSFLQFQFAIRFASNPALTKGTDWRGSFKYSVLGANANYTECSNIRDMTSNTGLFDTNLVTGNSNDIQTTAPVTFFPGTYYLLMGFSYWVNESKANPSLFPYSGNVTLSLSVQNNNGHIGFLSYTMGTNPSTHAYSKSAVLANSFRMVNYLDFTSKYRNATAFTSTNGVWHGLNGLEYDYGYLINVTGATAYNWTQLIAYYNHINNLAPGGASPGPTEINTGGISIIYNPMWGPAYNTTGQIYYKQKLNWQPSGTNTGGFQGQTPTALNATSGQYSMEFGVYAGSFMLWIMPNPTNKNNNETLCIQMAQFNTPKITFNANLPSAGINWTLIIVIVAVAAAAVVVVALLVVVKKKNPLGLKYGLRHLSKSKV